jgi:signal transduction histidine kinase
MKSDVGRTREGLGAAARKTPLKRRSKISSAAAKSFLPVMTAVLAGGIFIMDTVTDWEIAVDVLYVAVVLLSVGFCRTRGILLVSTGCIALTILSHFVAPTGSPTIGLINDGLGIVAILATTYLVLRMKSTEVAMHAARAQLAHVSRVTTLGELTALIAHEINQPLAAIVTNGNACMRWLARKPANLPEARNAVERIVQDGDRASNVIVRIRDFAKRSQHQKEWLDVNDAIREIVALTANEIQQNRISLRARLADDMPPILADRIEMQQVMLNLILNAVEAVGAAPEGARDVLIATASDVQGNVLVSVRDSGGGISAQTVDRLFEPFYTTKPEGMGMGLTISRSIVEAHGGRIWASSDPPHGTVVQFTLPTDPNGTKLPRSAAKTGDKNGDKAGVKSGGKRKRR